WRSAHTVFGFRARTRPPTTATRDFGRAPNGVTFYSSTGRSRLNLRPLRARPPSLVSNGITVGERTRRSESNAWTVVLFTREQRDERSDRSSCLRLVHE